MLPSCKNTRNVASAHKALQLDPEALSKAKKNHFKAPKTTQAYSYTIGTAHKWLHQVVLEATNSTSSTSTSTSTTSLFLHPLAASLFDNPPTVTAHILAHYLSAHALPHT